MEFTIGLIRNEEQYLVKSFGGTKSGKVSIKNVNELENDKIDVLLYPQVAFFNGLGPKLEQSYKFFPVRTAEDFKLEEESFEGLELLDAEAILTKARESWSLQNNIGLIEEIFKLKNHLSNLWKNDRTTFFEEFWYIFKRNTGASECRMFYNNIRKSTKENEKDKLIVSIVEGDRLPKIRDARSEESMLMDHYKKEFHGHFEIVEYSKDKAEFVAAATIKQSPILIMAKLNSLSSVQKALISALFQGLND